MANENNSPASQSVIFWIPSITTISCWLPSGLQCGRGRPVHKAHVHATSQFSSIKHIFKKTKKNTIFPKCSQQMMNILWSGKARAPAGNRRALGPSLRARTQTIQSPLRLMAIHIRTRKSYLTHRPPETAERACDVLEKFHIVPNPTTPIANSRPKRCTMPLSQQ
jgi:hypothetical protein